jgi:hypothetical protein
MADLLNLLLQLSDFVGEDDVLLKPSRRIHQGTGSA